MSNDESVEVSNDSRAPSSCDSVTRAPKPPETARAPLPIRPADQLLFGSVCIIALASMALYCFRVSQWGSKPIELERHAKHEYDFQIDLNSATWVEWSQLPGIGTVLAQRIVEDRQQNGPFRDVEALDRVRGIGPKKIDALRPFIRATSIADDGETP